MSTRDNCIALLQGTLDLLTLRPGRAHGHAIAKAIEQTSASVLQLASAIAWILHSDIARET